MTPGFRNMPTSLSKVGLGVAGRPLETGGRRSCLRRFAQELRWMLENLESRRDLKVIHNFCYL